MVIVFVTVSGLKDGQLMQETYANKIYAQRMGGQDDQRHPDHHRRRPSARCWTCWPTGELPPTGFIRQEDIALADFLANRFGRVYARRDGARAPWTPP